MRKHRGALAASRSFCAFAVMAVLAGCSEDATDIAPDAQAAADEVAATGADAAAAEGMDLDALYSLPAVAGTSPGLPGWSSNGERLAFVWNNEGRPFRDIWFYAPKTGDLRRLTNHEDDVEPGSLHRGVGEFVWVGSERLAYVLDGKLYLTDTDGRTRQVEGQQAGVRDVQVAPDGRSLSWVAGPGGSDAGSGGGGALWVAALEEGTPGAARRLVKAGQEKAFVQSYEWSTDGERMAFVRADNSDMPEREIHYYADGGELQVDRVTRAFPGDETTRRSLGVVELVDGSITWLPLVDDQYPIWDYGLSADGGKLYANTSNHLVKEHTVYLFDVATGEREVFYQLEDPQKVIPGWETAWAPGDDGLILLTDRDGYYHLYHQREAGGELRALTSGNWEIASFEVDAAGEQLYFVANETHPAERQVYRVPFGGGAIEAVTQEPGTWSPAFSPDFSRVALHFSNDTTPPELYVRELRAGSDVTRITRSPLPGFDDYTWADVRYPRFSSHVDGTTLHARLSVPADFDPAKQYPLITGSVYADTLRNQWGGRTAHPTWGLDQYFVSRGYLVLNVNMRGSWGHGKAFSQGLLRDYGGIDIEDIESGVRHVVSEGYVDPDRVGIWGSSYGGLMTLMSLFKKPDVYAAGIAGAPATNVWHAFPSQQWVMGEPRGDDYPERYRRQSALYHHEGLQDPLMIIHGTSDPVVLYSDTIALVEGMIAGKKQFELVTLPGGSHSWATDSVEQTRFTFHKMAAFFDRHLK